MTTPPEWPREAEAAAMSDDARLTFRYPGVVKGSYGYYNDGEKRGDSNGWESYGPRFSEGDVVGCGVFSDACFFTKNAEFLGVAFRGVQKRGLHPTVGLSSIIFGAITAKANFGQKAFRYDLDWERVRSLCRR